MPAQKPEDADILIGQAINAKDPDAALDLYEADAILLPEPGQVAQGTDAIREAINGFVSLNPTLNVEVENVVQSGDIALLYSKWTLTGTDPEGNAVNASGRGREVVRRQADGTWRFVIDDPNGAT